MSENVSEETQSDDQPTGQLLGEDDVPLQVKNTSDERVQLEGSALKIDTEGNKVMSGYLDPGEELAAHAEEEYEGESPEAEQQAAQEEESSDDEEGDDTGSPEAEEVSADPEPSANGPPSGEEPQGEEEQSASGVDPSLYSRSQLQRMAREQGVSDSGTKTQIAARLSG